MIKIISIITVWAFRQQRRIRNVIGLWFITSGMVCAFAAEDCVKVEPTDYRYHTFQAPVPCSLTGATVVSTAEVKQLVTHKKVLLIDVIPRARRPKNLPSDALWQPLPRYHLPSSVWLPNTGFGTLPIEEENYLRFHLLRLTQAQRAWPVLFYCLQDCWMSWNAARRAVAWGYSSVFWYPGGSDDWAAAGLPLVEGTPAVRKPGQ